MRFIWVTKTPSPTFCYAPLLWKVSGANSFKPTLCNSFALHQQLPNHNDGTLTFNRMNGVNVSVTLRLSYCTRQLGKAGRKPGEVIYCAHSSNYHDFGKTGSYLMEKMLTGYGLLCLICQWFMEFAQSNLQWLQTIVVSSLSRVACCSGEASATQSAGVCITMEPKNSAWTLTKWRYHGHFHWGFSVGAGYWGF